MNVGTGQKTTIENLVKVFNKTFNKELDPKFGTMRNRDWDQKDWYANNNKAKSLLNIDSYISLNEGIKLMYDKINYGPKINFMTKTKKDKTDNSRNSISAVIACYKDEQAIPIILRGEMRVTLFYLKRKLNLYGLKLGVKKHCYL